MNTKKFVLTFLLVFVLLEILNYIIHGVILGPVYTSDEVKVLFRPNAEIMGMMWLMWVVDLIWAFFFVFFFVKGYENKGVMEGVRFGLYVGIFWNLVSAVGQYTVYPIPIYLVLHWIIYGIITAIILGAIAAVIYKPKTIESVRTAVV